MAGIELSVVDESTFRVQVREGGSTSTHDVTVNHQDLVQLSGQHSADQLVEASFRFLLDREPKESILSSFDLSVIERYFPEYPVRIADYL